MYGCRFALLPFKKYYKLKNSRLAFFCPLTMLKWHCFFKSPLLYGPFQIMPETVLLERMRIICPHLNAHTLPSGSKGDIGKSHVWLKMSRLYFCPFVNQWLLLKLCHESNDRRSRTHLLNTRTLNCVLASWTIQI